MNEERERTVNGLPQLAAYQVLGVKITPLTKAEWLKIVRVGVETGHQKLLVSQNMHSAYLVPRTPVLERVQKMADVVRIDGMPLVWFARLLGLPVRRKQRAGFMDLMPLLMHDAAALGWKVMVLAGKPGVAERAAGVLRERYPNLKITTLDGYFPLDDSDGAVSERLDYISKFSPDILLIGMGMPRQEEFLERYLPRINVPVVGTCGAAFDYVAGVIPMAPRWLSRLGFEWLYRLLAEPRRLWRRYLLEPLAVFPRAVKDLWKRREGAEVFILTRDDRSTQ